ncbi:MAG: hypothetical protein COW00_07480 [Bdellovibrio sp. CG12_big_fil_rev_8_21_14_0_65_39_13]|nr:MAG: hypothetical protein COW78_10585 [Bdellovibrio sp. CG22_combo_CG10-13_8_21_14_all_39_27]PIQ60211.1 MAG: hypothetical protein COW00_07480 [Bdellovibrio sp. CG12_big_fil_rev_8_21_14_0_65_39_13]PIR32358.1 MAG: hypothetical protein COV37_20150 [Bdellovibrio sp. CG11_big_fil_rev_8_21_14_0_20_39_38]PJB54495.1 MAG: hypothetical protein CO099_01280 [Bdellovibrio sp. CG_4_9_14_3_um_filter_39_7]
MKLIINLFLILSMASFSAAVAQTRSTKGKEQIIYKYKKYQKFDFEDLVIEGETGAPSDLSISPRFKRVYKNPLPYRKNFNDEIRKGIERVR